MLFSCAVDLPWSAGEDDFSSKLVHMWAVHRVFGVIPVWLPSGCFIAHSSQMNIHLATSYLQLIELILILPSYNIFFAHSVF